MLNVVKRVDATTSTPSSPVSLLSETSSEPHINQTKSTISVGTQISSDQLSPIENGNAMSSVATATVPIVDLSKTIAALKEIRPNNNNVSIFVIDTSHLPCGKICFPDFSIKFNVHTCKKNNRLKSLPSKGNIYINQNVLHMK